MEVAGPLGTPLGLAQRKRASPRGEAGTSGFLCALAPHERLPEILVVPREIKIYEQLFSKMDLTAEACGFLSILIMGWGPFSFCPGGLLDSLCLLLAVL